MTHSANDVERAPAVPGDVAESRRWIAEWTESHGRPLRVLHVGNIANNAYLIGKILNREGVEADVLCGDYTHIMGCPEWEDVYLLRPYGDDFLPQFSEDDVADYTRPIWYAQGPLGRCIDYLMLPREQRKRSLDLLAGGSNSRPDRRNEPRGVRIAKSLIILHRRAYSMMAKIHGRAVRRYGERSNLTLVAAAAKVSVQWLLCQSVRLPLRIAGRKLGEASRRVARQARAADGTKQIRLTVCDLVPYAKELDAIGALFASYDVIQLYGADPITGLAAGTQPYLALEHGTIRKTPFEPTAEGQLLAMAYRAASHVFITNCDNIAAAKELGLQDYSFLPHPVNEDLSSEGLAPDSTALRKALCEELDADLLIFHPSRQHWGNDRDPNREKGNDIFLRGLATFIKAGNTKTGAVLVEWGERVQQSKSLIAELGISDKVKWIKPQSHPGMMRYILATDALADQFYLGAFGSTLPKALMCARPVLVNIDEDAHRWCLPDPPPVLNVDSPQAVASALTQLDTDPKTVSEIRERGRDWYVRYHSNYVVLSRLVQVYRAQLGNQPRSHLA